MVRPRKLRSFEKTPQWGVSLLVHAAVIGLMMMWSVDIAVPKARTLVESELEEIDEEVEIPEELISDEELDLDAAVTLIPGSRSEVAAALEAVSVPANTFAETQKIDSVLSDRSLFRPISTGITGMNLDSNIEGLVGDFSMSSSEEGFGSIEQITKEILRELGKNKVLVGWLMDASISLEKRREVIATRLDRIYEELYSFPDITDPKNGALLTAVVSYGQSTNFMLRKPTSNLEEIRKSIRSILNDDSGKELVCTALRETANNYRRYTTGGQRTMMLIVLTDEIGDDPEIVDETTEYLRQLRIPVYVLGPMATFGRHVVHMKWESEESTEPFWYRILRGPCTREMEILKVRWDPRPPYRSGFGPFTLANLVLRTGGIYFIYDDMQHTRKLRVPYDPIALLRYKPSFVPAPDYNREIIQSKYRATLMDVVTKGNQFFAQDLGENRLRRYRNYGYGYHGWFPADDQWREHIANRQEKLVPFNRFATDEAIPRMLELDEERSKEPSPRWRANFDLTLARLLRIKIRSDSRYWAYERFLQEPKEHVHRDPEKEQDIEHWRPVWRIRFIPEIWVGKIEEPIYSYDSKTKRYSSEQLAKSAKPKAKSQKPKAEPSRTRLAKRRQNDDLELYEKTLEEAKRVRIHYQRVIDEHPGTSWAEVARGEIRDPLGARIEPTYHRIHTEEEDRNRRKALEKAPKGF